MITLTEMETYTNNNKNSLGALNAINGGWINTVGWASLSDR